VPSSWVEVNQDVNGVNREIDAPGPAIHTDWPVEFDLVTNCKRKYLGDLKLKTRLSSGAAPCAPAPATREATVVTHTCPRAQRQVQRALEPGQISKGPRSGRSSLLTNSAAKCG